MMERAGRWIIASIFIASGVLHFAIPQTFARIIPPMFPHPGLLVLISGGAEILGGLGLLMPGTRRPAAFGLTILLIAVFPANIYMAVAHVPFKGLLGNRWLQWFRLPLQIPLICWAWRYTRSDVALSRQSAS